jgi:hypothetical protein
VFIALAQPRHRKCPLPSYAQPLLSRTARHAGGGRATGVEHRGLPDFTSACLHTSIGAINRLLRSVSSYLCCALLSPTPAAPRRRDPPRYRLNHEIAAVVWAASITTSLQDLRGTDLIGSTALSLRMSSLTRPLTPTATTTTYANSSRLATRKRSTRCMPLPNPWFPTRHGCACKAQSRWHPSTDTIHPSTSPFVITGTPYCHG